MLRERQSTHTAQVAEYGPNDRCLPQGTRQRRGLHRIQMTPIQTAPDPSPPATLLSNTAALLGGTYISTQQFSVLLVAQDGSETEFQAFREEHYCSVNSPFAAFSGCGTM